MKWTSEKIEKIKELLSDGKRFGDISEYFGVTRKSIVCICNKHKLRQNYHKMYLCEECGVEFKCYISNKRRFCSSNCSAKHSNKKRKLSKETKNKISETLKSKKKRKDKKRFCDCGNEILEKRKKLCKKCKNNYYKYYRPECEFDFNIKLYANKFDISLVEKYGWYSPTNKGNNLNGVSKDHMFSVKDGFINNVDPEIIKHPANCELMLHKNNNKKNTKSTITLEELMIRIENW